MKARLRHFPISLKRARAFVGKEHRHIKKTAGGKFAIGARFKDELVGVVIVGRTTGPNQDEEVVAEITRLATNGKRNACSFLIRRARRAIQAMGYQRLITYNRRGESGASLRGAGCVPEAPVRARQWNRKKRPRAAHEAVDKVRWRVA